MVNGLAPGEIVLWAAVFGLLIGVIWSLKYIVIIDRRIEKIERHINSIVSKRGKSTRKTKKRVTRRKRRR